MHLTLKEVKEQVFNLAKLSPCSKRKVGCVIARLDNISGNYISLGAGYNFHPDGEACEIVRERKTIWGGTVPDIITDPKVIHAEQNAVDNFFEQKKTSGLNPIWFEPENCEIFVNHMPCSNCVRYLTAAGFKATLNLTVIGDTMAEQPTGLQATLNERGSRYGEFKDNAATSQALKTAMYGVGCVNWNKLAPDQKEALEMIQHKIARIINGDPDYDDSWVDIAGYAQLIVNRLQKKEA